MSPAALTSLDLSAIPKMSPSLGLQHGHNRRDLAARSASKRRPASMKKTLLLNTEEGERMGTQRVSLSEERSNTLPTQVRVRALMTLSCRTYRVTIPFSIIYVLDLYTTLHMFSVYHSVYVLCIPLCVCTLYTTLHMYSVYHSGTPLE